MSRPGVCPTNCCRSGSVGHVKRPPPPSPNRDANLRGRAPKGVEVRTGVKVGTVGVQTWGRALK